jgi:hypothetical protein
MEGMLSHENFTRATSGSLLVAGCIFTCFSASALFMRKACRDLDSGMSARVQIFEAQQRIEENEQIKALILPHLETSGLGIADLMHAVSRINAVEVQLRELYELSKSSSVEVKIIENPTIRRIVESLVSQGVPGHELLSRAISELVKTWRNAGAFDKSRYPDRQVFGTRESSEAVGCDIGCIVRTSLGDEGEHLHSMSFDHTLESSKHLDRWGFALIRRAVDAELVQRISNELNLTQGPASGVGTSVVKLDPNVSHNRAVANRLQLLLRGSRLEELTYGIHSAVLPIVSMTHARRSGDDSDLVLSDVRLVVVDEGAQEGNWTLFNPRGGFTVIIPLHDRDTRMGMFRMLVGSHFLANRTMSWYRRFQYFINRYSEFPYPVSMSECVPDGCIRAGDAIILDNRALLQMEGNRIFKSGSYLLAKYEPKTALVPELFFLGKFLFRLPQFLSIISRWSLPSPTA